MIQIYLFLFLALVSNTAFGQIESIWLYESSPPQTLQAKGQVNEEWLASDIQTIERLPKSLWQPVSINQTHFGFYTGPVWFRLNLKPESQQKILFISNSNLDLLEVYSEPALDSISLQETPAWEKLTGFHLFGPNAGQGFQLPQGLGQVLVKVKNDGPIFLPVYLGDQKAFTHHQTTMTWIFGVLIGLILLGILVFLRLLIAAPSSQLVYAVLISGFILIYLMAGYGVLESLFYANWHWLQAPLLLLSMSFWHLLPAAELPQLAATRFKPSTQCSAYYGKFINFADYWLFCSHPHWLSPWGFKNFSYSGAVTHLDDLQYFKQFLSEKKAKSKFFITHLDRFDCVYSLRSPRICWASDNFSI